MVAYEQQRFPELVDIETLAKLLGVNERFLRRKVHQKELPYVKVGRFVRFDLADVRTWLDEHRQPRA